jgi:acetyl-CoA acetyltransferase
MTERRAVAVVGAAVTKIGLQPDRTSVGLAGEALRDSLEDAGLSREDIDGVSVNLGYPLGDNYDRLTDELGLRVKFAAESWTHGRFTGSMFMQAARAIANNLADVVVCLNGLKWDLPPVRLDVPHIGDYSRYGMAGAADPAALSLRRYMHLYGADPDRLGRVVLTFRRHAALNPRAMFRDPLTWDDYLASPKLIDPLRELDRVSNLGLGTRASQAGISVILASANIAKTLRQPPVYVIGTQPMQAGPEEAYMSRPGLGLFMQTTSTFQPTANDMAVYRAAGLKPGDMDGFYPNDNFSPFAWFLLERFGHCRPGEAHEWVTEERIALDGELPMNSNGGHMSEGQTTGWGQLVEMVHQLRHTCGERQIKDAELLQWATVFGDSIILGNEPIASRS